MVLGVLRLGSVEECERQLAGHAALELTGRFLSMSSRAETDVPEMSCLGNNLAYAWISGAPGVEQAKQLHATAEDYALEWGDLGSGPSAGYLATSGAGWTGEWRVESACYRQSGMEAIELGAPVNGTVFKVVVAPTSPGGPMALVMASGTFQPTVWMIGEDDPAFEEGVLFHRQGLRLAGVTVPRVFGPDGGRPVRLSGQFDCSADTFFR